MAILDRELQAAGCGRRRVDLALALGFLGRAGGDDATRAYDVRMGLRRCMGKQAGQRAGACPAQHRQRMPVVLAVMVDAMGFRAFAGLLAVAHEHDHFGCVGCVGHVRICRLGLRNEHPAKLAQGRRAGAACGKFTTSRQPRLALPAAGTGPRLSPRSRRCKRHSQPHRRRQPERHGTGIGHHTQAQRVLSRVAPASHGPGAKRRTKTCIPLVNPRALQLRNQQKP